MARIENHVTDQDRETPSALASAAAQNEINAIMCAIRSTIESDEKLPATYTEAAAQLLHVFKELVGFFFKPSWSAANSQTIAGSVIWRVGMIDGMEQNPYESPRESQSRADRPNRQFLAALLVLLALVVFASILMVAHLRILKARQ